jgi:hypothetical protein
MRTLLKAALVATSVPLFSPFGHIAPCEYEDGSSQYMCVWDAKHQGNGRGHSALIIRGGHDDQVVIRLPHRLAHQLSH